MKKMDKILTYENREMSMARIRASITLIILRKTSNIFTCQLIFKSKFYIREERFRDIFLRTKSILLGIARMSGGGGQIFGTFSRSALLVNTRSLFLTKCQ